MNRPLSRLPAAFGVIVLGVIVLGTLVGVAIGMTIGTLVTPRRINIMFAVVLMPIMFTAVRTGPAFSVVPAATRPGTR
jgi:ABC-2 type transport system permease protein